MANEDNTGSSSMASSETAEVRGPCAKDTVDVLDAISMARGLTRMQLVNEILGEWARMRRHELNVVSKVLRIKTGDSGFGGLGRQ